MIQHIQKSQITYNCYFDCYLTQEISYISIFLFIFSWMTFSAGRKNCPGELLDRPSHFLALTYLLQSFTFSSPEGEDPADPVPRNYVNDIVIISQRSSRSRSQLTTISQNRYGVPLYLKYLTFCSCCTILCQINSLCYIVYMLKHALKIKYYSFYYKSSAFHNRIMIPFHY